MAVAGKVAITLSTENGGAWSASVTYDRLVAVTHNNNLYISRKTVANVEPPNDEFWFLALEGFSGDDIEDIINGTTQVGNALTLDGHRAEYFAPLTELANYLPLTSNTFKSVKNAQDVVMGLESIAITTNQLALLRFIRNGTYLGNLGFSGENNPVFYPTDGSGEKNLLHTGNKPTGTYTGNGSAEQRIIATNGIGKVCVVNGSGRTAYVSIWGAIILSGTSVAGLDYTKMNFNNGNLKVATTDYINDSGETYTWDVL